MKCPQLIFQCFEPEVGNVANNLGLVNWYIYTFSLSSNSYMNLFLANDLESKLLEM